MNEPEQSPGVSRRRLLGYAGAGAAVGAAGFAGGMGAARATDGQAGPGIDRFTFHGEHQAGIVTPAQDRLHFAAFDVTATSRAPYPCRRRSRPRRPPRRHRRSRAAGGG